MVYWLFFSLLVISSFFIFKLIDVRHRLTAASFIAFSLSLLSMSCLAQNYTNSQVLNSQDGISISNFIAYLHIGEDGWSVEQFRSYYEASIYTALIILLLLVVSFIYETIRSKKKQMNSTV